MSEPKQQLFNHAYDFAFEVISNDERGKDVTGSMLREACIERAKRISDEEFLKACDRFDTHREGE